MALSIQNLCVMREALVIGGGPAGAAAATLLARAGRDVLLIEKEAGPHHKVCGEFISETATHYLQSLRFDPESLGAHPISRHRLSRGRQNISIQLPFQAYGLSRRHLDEALLQEAANSGAHIMRGDAVIRLTNASGLWYAETVHQTFIAPILFLASGKHDVRRWPRLHSGTDAMIGFKMHFKLRPASLEKLKHYIDLTFFEGGYAGLVLIEEDIANLCLVISKKTFHAQDKNWFFLIEKLKSSSNVFRELLEGATPCWSRPLAIAGLPYGYIQQRSSDPTFYRLGDQFAVIGSLAGEGLALALHSAFAAATCYIEGGTAKDYHTTVFQNLHPTLQAANIISCAAQSSASSLLFRAPYFSKRALNVAARVLRIPYHNDYLCP
jgi:flavin-dependent dehydrogenase